MKAGQPLRAIFAVPLQLALLSVFGLVAALTGDGWRDALSWGALASPIAAILWACARRRT
ncbi:MAG: hypothetical protein IE934_02375 [Sphingopyxis sp.]|nr:hypothetical protein [Sphingopyxis sp.]